MALDLTTFAAALKQHYTTDMVENMVYKDNPLLALIPKYEQFGGENLKLPIKYGIPQGRSATFATAQSNKTNTCKNRKNQSQKDKFCNRSCLCNLYLRNDGET